MVPTENSPANKEEPPVSSPETRSIGLSAQDATSQFERQEITSEHERHLSQEELASVAALPSGSALLIAHTGPNAGARFLLDEDVTRAGRHPNADIFLDDVTVSRQHAEFRRAGDGFTVVDTGSLNGTYVSNDRVDETVLHNGDEVQIGKFRLTFYAARSVTAQAAQHPSAQA
ncbi:FHA domain-containing protein [Arthrobacter echini]|uniref:FHA domain-containing protein n=1 Tax=Arthrobacter echini TaxID=1529066 RepID=A0A4S5E0N7_9MICC|nr:FHA domain-containing protein [Arthrobacter echini]THJ64871.1 FHA domain-containing protein [Arthrobacter echini]